LFQAQDKELTSSTEPHSRRLRIRFAPAGQLAPATILPSLMATISPFRAWRYASDRVSIRDVVTQPYDKISPAMQDSYYKASPYNLVRIILGKQLTGDGEQENVYSRAAAAFQEWRRSGVLSQDPEPSLDRYSQMFAVPGTSERAERCGFIAAGQIEDYSARVVFRHEQTLSKPKADRLNLLRATRAHFGQIFMLYSGLGRVDAILESSQAPDIEVTDEYSVLHRVWRVSDPGVIARVQEEMKQKNLIIADGHHRYETALAYRSERRAAAGNSDAAAYDSVMMTFVDVDRPGLVVLPTHRLVFGLRSLSAERFRADVSKYFNVEDVDPTLDAARTAGILRQAGHAGTALLAVGADRAFLLHTPKAMGTTLFSSVSLRQQALDVVQLHKCVLEGVLRISEEAVRNQQNVSYCRETSDALTQVRSGKVQMAFLMNPVRIEQVRDIAFAGEVLPQKSTDFYPKLLSGLTVYALE
jgi:uncharacterized protein (DUF1015 family)